MCLSIFSTFLIKKSFRNYSFNTEILDNFNLAYKDIFRNTSLTVATYTGMLWREAF